MQVFVRVKVTNREAARLNSLNLGNGLGFYISFTNPAPHQIADKRAHRGP